jgi:hypothetical protein
MVFRTPWDAAPAPEVSPELPETMPAPPKKRGRRPTPKPETDRGGRAGQGGWLYHHLTITGPADRVAAFAEAARGSGIGPWRVDGARIEEDIFNLAASQPKEMRSLTIQGCRILARQFRERVEARAARAAALVGSRRASGRTCPGGACPFDLNTLLPVPAAILDNELTHPKAQAWLLDHWGLSDVPRQVVVRTQATAGKRLSAGHTVLGYGFFTAGETPHAAIAGIAEAWSDLRFVLQPRPVD